MYCIKFYTAVPTSSQLTPQTAASLGILASFFKTIVQNQWCKSTEFPILSLQIAYHICSNISALWDLRNFFGSNLRRLPGHQLFLGGTYLIGTYCHVGSIDITNNRWLSWPTASGIDVNLSCLLHLSWALTYCFDVFLELETTILMATVPVTRAWFSDQSETSKKDWN